MTVPPLTPYTGLGGLHGGHWLPGAQAYGYPPNGADPTYARALSQAQTNFYAQLAATYESARTRLRAIEHAGITAGEIIAWRCWNCDGEELCSMFVGTLWKPDEPMTGDISIAGVHAWKEKMDAVNYGMGLPSLWPVVVGRVKLWGEVIEYEKGYTAENGRIYTLDWVLHGSFLKYKNKRILEKMRKKYGIGQ